MRPAAPSRSPISSPSPSTAQLVNAICARLEPKDDVARRLLRVTLANYFAGAVMMPYARFHAARRGDRPRPRGAGRALRRQLRAGRAPPHHAEPPHGAGNSLLSRARRHRRQRLEAVLRGPLSLCPGGRHLRIVECARDLRRARPNPHAGGRAAGRRTMVLDRPAPCAAPPTRTARSPRASRSRSAARSNTRRASSMPAASTSPRPTSPPIGVACRLCERPACPQRAAPPALRPLDVDDTMRGVSPVRVQRDLSVPVSAGRR